MTSLRALFGFRDARRPQRRRAALRDLRPEALEPRALLAVTVPPDITSSFVSIDDDVLVATGAASIKATAGSVQIFGNSTGRIDAVTAADVANLAIEATTAIGVTGAIGSVTPFDSLTLTSTSAQAVSLGQAVTLDDDLTITKAGTVTFGGAVVVGDAAGDDLTIADATSVMFVGNVVVAGDLVITKATTVTFAGTLTVGGHLRIANASGAVRFLGEVTVGAAEVTSQDRVFIQGDFTSTGAVGSGDVTFTTDQVGFNSAVIATAAATPTATLTVQPFTKDRAIAIASPPGVAAGLAITDAALAAIQSGWKRVVFGREADGTGAVTIGSVGSQQGFSQLLNTTTIVGGSVVVDDSVELVLPVDVTSQAAYLELVARGPQGITVNAPINQTADERNAWVRLTSAGPIALNAPIWATSTVSLTTTDGGTVTQQPTGAAAITAPNLVVVADGSVTLADSGNAFDTVAISTTGDDVVLREDSGYAIGSVTTTDSARGLPAVTVSGVAAGSGIVRLVTVSGATASTVSQTSKIVAAALGLEGTGTDWLLASLTTDHNDVDTLAAKTGSVAFRDADDLTIGTVAAVAPQGELSGIDVARTVAVTAGTTLTILAAGDIASAATSGTAVDLAAASGISTAGDVTTKGADVIFRDATTLAGNAVLDVVDGSATGTVTFAKAVEGTGGLSVTGNLDAAEAIGATTALAQLTVTGGTTSLRGSGVSTTGAAGQSYGGPLQLFAATTLTGKVATGGTVAGNGNALTIAGDATLGDAAADTVTGISSLTVTGDAVVNASKVAATGTQTWEKTVTLGTDATFENGVLSFEGSIVGGGYDLTLTGSSVILGDADADSVTGVDDLVVTGPTVLNGNTITTTGTQTFDGGVTATQATAVTLSGKGFDFKQSLGRGEPGIVPPLTITAGTGGVTFGGDVGTSGRPFGTTVVRSEGGVSLAGTLWSNGPVTIASTKGSISGGVANAIRTPDTIRLEAATGIGTQAAPIGIEAASVSAVTATGGIFLRAVGDPGNLWIGPGGLVALAGPIGLEAGNMIGVYAGGRIQAGGGVSATRSISWQVTKTADDVNVAGSLRQVVRNLNEVGDANRTATENGLDARLSFEIVSVASPPATTVFSLATPLPELRAAVAIVGSGITFDGLSQSPGALVYGAAASGSTLQGVSLQNFREYAIQLRSAQNVTVHQVKVRGLNLITSMGVYATGNLAGTQITGSEFTGGLRGALLDNARGLQIGSLTAGQGNLFADNRAVPSQPRFAGTGIRAQGDCAGTVVQGNTFTGNNYGFAFMAARNLQLRNNFFARNVIAGIYVEGNSSGSVQRDNAFSTVNGQRNKANVVRARNARGA